MRILGRRCLALLLAAGATSASVSPGCAQSVPGTEGPSAKVPANLQKAPDGSFPTASEERLKQFTECLSNWDAGTHMSQAEWRAACRRTLDGRYF